VENLLEGEGWNFQDNEQTNLMLTHRSLVSQRLRRTIANYKYFGLYIKKKQDAPTLLSLLMSLNPKKGLRKKGKYLFNSSGKRRLKINVT
jgi:hypothetical protein